MRIGCQFSVYPLKKEDVGPEISRALFTLRKQGLEYEVGLMSSYTEGEIDKVFDGLKVMFKAAAARGDVVLITTISNATPKRKA